MYIHNIRQNIVGMIFVIFRCLDKIYNRKASNIASKPILMIGLPQTIHGFAETNAIRAAIIIEILEVFNFTTFTKICYTIYNLPSIQFLSRTPFTS